MSYRNVKLARHLQTLVGQYPMTDCCFQHYKRVLSVIQLKRHSNFVSINVVSVYDQQ